MDEINKALEQILADLKEIREMNEKTLAILGAVKEDLGTEI